MRREGDLTISAGFSRLDDTQLMKGALDNGGFGRATTFLRQDRKLKSGERIFVDGVDDEFNEQDVIVITDAGRPTGAPLGPAPSRGVKKSGKKTGKKTKKRAAKKPKKSTKKQSGKKTRAKKSAAKKR